jgi:hypothetical protein
VRSGALFRNGNGFKKAQPGPLQITASTFAKREEKSLKNSRREPGFLLYGSIFHYAGLVKTSGGKS